MESGDDGLWSHGLNGSVMPSSRSARSSAVVGSSRRTLSPSASSARSEARSRRSTVCTASTSPRSVMLSCASVASSLAALLRLVARTPAAKASAPPSILTAWSRSPGTESRMTSTPTRTSRAHPHHGSRLMTSLTARPRQGSAVSQTGGLSRPPGTGPRRSRWQRKAR
uniref:Uncharacterized protein n=1 Tax=uncultured marine virus TaxID=186617 RepID=A0A0F7L910_9VIRU|nr:hypothetical protein [uncultured marine virus]